MVPERRRTRSSQPTEAIGLLLHCVQQRLRMLAITLGTVSGSLLVGVGEDPRRVAELGAGVDAGKKASERVATWRLRVGQSDLLLTSLGGRMDPELGTGVRRIFAESSE
jgi:hypothetical protein